MPQLPNSPIGPPPPPPVNVPPPVAGRVFVMQPAPLSAPVPGAANVPTDLRYELIRAAALMMILPTMAAVFVLLGRSQVPARVPPVAIEADAQLAPLDEDGNPIPAEFEFQLLRERWRHQLIRKGPAPGEQRSLENTPADAIVVTYTYRGPAMRGWFHDRAGTQQHNLPAVVYLHDGFSLTPAAWEQTRPFRDRGWVVLAPALRGENGNPGSFEYLGAEADDVIAATEHLWNLWYVDRRRIYVVGNGVGGSLAAIVALLESKGRRFVAVNPESVCGTGFADVFEPGDFERNVRSPALFGRCVQAPLGVFLVADSRDGSGKSQVSLQDFRWMARDAEVGRRPPVKVFAVDAAGASMETIAAWLENQPIMTSSR